MVVLVVHVVFVVLKIQPYCLLSKKENNLYNLYNFIQPQNVSGRQPRLFWLYMLYVLS